MQARDDPGTRSASSTPMAAANRHRLGSGNGAPSAPPTLSLHEPLLDVEAAASLLNVKVSWIREATRSGLLPCIKVGRQVRWTRPMLEQWLMEHRTGL